MNLSSADYQLSMRTSRRGRQEIESDWRSLLVHRLRKAAKAVVRLSLSRDIETADTASAYSVHCEPCNGWFTLPAWGEEVHCPKCGTLYLLEYAVFSAAQS